MSSEMACEWTPLRRSVWMRDGRSISPRRTFGCLTKSPDRSIVNTAIDRGPEFSPQRRRGFLRYGKRQYRDRETKRPCHGTDRELGCSDPADRIGLYHSPDD